MNVRIIKNCFGQVYIFHACTSFALSESAGVLHIMVPGTIMLLGKDTPGGEGDFRVNVWGCIA